jgi:protein O-mannosyl-transferase
VALLVGTCLLYWPAVELPFVNYDDDGYVTRNVHVLGGLSFDNIHWAFTTFQNANWHPLTWLSLQLDATLFGTSPEGFHRTNVLLHAINAGLFFLLARRLGMTALCALFTAGLFAVHPVHVQSVVWVTERKDVLSTLFWLLALIAYVRTIDGPSIRWWACAVGAMLLSLMAKPMAVTLPFVLLLLDYWPLRSRRAPRATLTRLILQKLPLLLLVAAYSAVVFEVQRRSGAVGSAEAVPLSSRLAVAVTAYANYLRLLIWPWPLLVLYPFAARNWSEPAVWGSLALLMGITMSVVSTRRRWPWLLVGWLWFVGTLVPVIGLVQIGEHAYADRYAYIPFQGLSLAIGWSLDRLAVQKSRVRMAIGFAMVGMIALAGVTRTQIAVWQSSETLWSHTLQNGGDSATAWCGLADAQRDAGKYDDAVASYRRAIGMNPNMFRARANLIWTFVLMDRLADAEREYAQLGLKEGLDLQQHYQLGVTASESGQSSLAIAAFAHVVHHQPQNGLAHLRLALELMKRDGDAAALRHFRNVEEHAPTLLKLPGVQEALTRAQSAGAER